MGISCSNISISIKTFPKHTFQQQIASFLLLCKQGNIFCLFFEEQLNKIKENNMLSFNPILSQSRATQSLQNPQLCWCLLCAQMSSQVLFPYLYTTLELRCPLNGPKWAVGLPNSSLPKTIVNFQKLYKFYPI